MQFITNYNFFYFPLLLLMIVSTYLLGHVFLTTINKRKLPSYFSFFFKSIIGYLIIIFLYSLIKSKGITIHGLLTIPFILLIITFKKDKYFQVKSTGNKFSVFYFAIPIALIFFFQTLYFYNPFTGISYSLDTDNFYYANIGSFIQQIGIENRFLDWINGDSAKPEIYHYADTWLVAIFAEFGLPSAKTITLVVNAFFYFQLYLGALSILEIKTEINFFKSIFALSIFFISCFFINYEDFTFFGYGCVTLVYPKLALITVYLLLSFYFVVQKQYYLLLFSLLSISVIYVALMPPILIGFTLFIITMWLFKKVNSNTSLIFGLILFVFSISFIIYFKTIFSQIDPRLVLEEKEKLSVIAVVISKIKDIVYTFLFNYFYFLKQIIPYLLLTGFIYIANAKSRQTTLTLSLFYIFLLLGGMVVFGLRYNYLDSIQFYQNLAYPLTGILGFYYLCEILFTEIKYKTISRAFVLILLVFNLYSSFQYLKKMHEFNMVYNISKDKKYVNEVMHLVSTEKNPRFAVAKGKADYKTIYDKAYTNTLNPFIGNKINTYMPTSITVFDIPLSEKVEYAEMEKTWIDNSALNFYIQKHKQEKDTTKLQIQFLKANKIQFLEMAKNYKIPSEINEIIDTMVINERNGVKFAKIKKEHYNKY